MLVDPGECGGFPGWERYPAIRVRSKTCVRRKRQRPGCTSSAAREFLVHKECPKAVRGLAQILSFRARTHGLSAASRDQSHSSAHLDSDRHFFPQMKSTRRRIDLRVPVSSGPSPEVHCIEGNNTGQKGGMKSPFSSPPLLFGNHYRRQGFMLQIGALSQIAKPHRPSGAHRVDK